MQTDRYDWLLVQLDEVGEAVSKIAAALLDVEVDQEQLLPLDQQTDALLEEVFDHGRIALVDARTAAMILRPPSRIRAYAQLLAQKSRLLHELGRVQASHALAGRALALQLEAADLETDPEKVDHAAIEALLDRDPPLHLGARQQQLLDALDGSE
ncbi:hypothetical protein DB30_05076 [Enhygromyxa salina]|uniref:Uncharacterized protein n=1 Tax=Enhygromyxa salina TaxID=215803 RepID=A0A0C2D7M1_9BACT|nr:hypothetical protein [Enhygromyxa salina]KIG16022.1 hypothetical protein DB30_05076 [Enhygromyxa salina]